MASGRSQLKGSHLESARSRPRVGRRCALIGLVAACALVSAAPDTAVAANRRETLDQLVARSERLAQRYRGELLKLTEARRAVSRATGRAKRLERELAEARKQVAQLAATKYMSGGLEPSLALLTSDDPQALVDDTALVEFLAASSGERITIAQRLADNELAARAQVRDRAADLRKVVRDLERRRAAVESQIAKYGVQSASPGSITPRMTQVRNELIQRFGGGYGIGCYRGGGFGEHPLGRACDFMMSSGGAMPSAAMVRRGDEIAAWGQANAGRLGIMYIIWRQRFWDSRSGGWDLMEDRGSITQNHYDHVHISVF